MSNRGISLRLRGLPKQAQRKFRRAVIFAGAPSQSAWLAAAIRRLIRQQEKLHGDLLNALTPDEVDMIEVIQDGANDPQHIAVEMVMPPHRLQLILDDLVERGVLEVHRQGGKTDQARGARRPLYFVSEKYQSKGKE